MKVTIFGRDRQGADSKRPWDVCEIGHHRMATKSGYTRCRKHASYPRSTPVPPPPPPRRR